MLINEDMRRCVAFLCVDLPNEETGVTNRQPAATAFFVGVPIDNDAWICYAVTARHAIDLSHDYGTLYLRVNTKDGYLVEERERLRQEFIKQRPSSTPDTGLPVENYQRSDFMRDLMEVAKKQGREGRPDQEKR